MGAGRGYFLGGGPMMERWRTIQDFPQYRVSNLGRVRHGTLNLKLSAASDGYVRVSLSNGAIRKQRNVHLLVARAFVLNPLNLPTVNHRDTKRTNNRASNLEWRSRKGQMFHARITTFKDAGIWFMSGRKKPWRATYTDNGKHVHIGMFATKDEAQRRRAEILAALPYVD